MIDDGIPILGVCFAHQYLTELLGGKVERSPSDREFGGYLINISADGEKDPLFSGINNPFVALESHNDVVVRPAPGSILLASSKKVSCQAFRWRDNVRGVQFHPEMTPEILASIIVQEQEDSEEYTDTTGRNNDPGLLHAGPEILANFISICLNHA